MFQRISWCILLLAPALWPADKPPREIQELQRDVAQLQDAVRTLQRSLEGQITSMGTQVKGATDAAIKATAAMANLQSSIDRLAQELERKLLTPVASLGNRMDQVTGAVGAMQQAMGDLNATIGKLQAKIDDLGMTVKVMQQPAAPPPVSTSSGPTLPASELYVNAEKDRGSGKLDLALQEYADYLKWYADAPQAANAQYYIGWIHYSQKDYENALKDFDALIARYPDSTKLPEAYFYKGQALTALGRANEASDAYRELRRRFPNHSLTRQLPAASRAR